MLDRTPNASQENVILLEDPFPNEKQTTSPTLPIASQTEGSRLRKPPTITPRSFTRFFTPKTSLKKLARSSASRRVLRDITASQSNRQVRKIDYDVARDADLHDTASSKHRSKRRRMESPPSPAITVADSSPLKNFHSHSEGKRYQDHRGRESAPFASDDELGANGSKDIPQLSRDAVLHRSKYRQSLGWKVRQETAHVQTWNVPMDSLRSCAEWQRETSNFYSKPEDSHSCHVIPSAESQTIPFCTVGCHTNSLVAVGDEDGGVRILESAEDKDPGFGKAWVAFKPHANAILDLAFSPDDMLLATGSGDQTSQIIDMLTQQTVHTLVGHRSSVKQVRFQPGSSNLVATSSREGTVKMWDLRCKDASLSVGHLHVPMDPSSSSMSSRKRRTTSVRLVNTIWEADSRRWQAGSAAVLANKAIPPQSSVSDVPPKTEAPRRSGDLSVTGLAFLPAPRSELLLTASEANATVKLWDLRCMSSSRRSSRAAVPLSTTKGPESHTQHRHFGLTSLSLSGDGARLYTLCRDNTVYVYSTSHLVLGHAPELSSTSVTKHRRSIANSTEKSGLGPLYGFRHPKFLATTFYVSSALRPAKDDRGEMLAVGSSDGCAVLFPTDERSLRSARPPQPPTSVLPVANLGRRPGLTRVDSGSLSARLNDTIPIYQHGTALIRGHSREVTGLSWTFGGELVSLGDDHRARCWREADRTAARFLRTGGEGEGKRWDCGWADVEPGWDDEEC